MKAKIIKLALDTNLLKRLRASELEDKEQRGYEAHPQRSEEYAIWEKAAAWPKD